MRIIKKIVIHCSDSNFGNAQLINDLHTAKDNPLIPLAWPVGTESYYQNPFDKIGYHYVILNGYIRPGEYLSEMDGTIEKGRDENEEGAHCYGQNKDSLGICLLGHKLFSARQLYWALPALLNSLCQKYSLSFNDIYGHYQFNPLKKCPNIEIELIRNILKSLLFYK